MMSEPYNAISAIIPAGEPSLTMLADAMTSETRLITDLIGIMRRQRRAVAEDDLQAVEDSVFATHRVLATLNEARLRRRALNRMFGVREDIRIAAMEELLGARMTPELAQLRDALQDTAKTLSEEVSVNRDILRGALAGGEAHVRALAGGTTPPTYGTGSGLQSASGRVFLNVRA
jgi:hypothetical protein